MLRSFFCCCDSSKTHEGELRFDLSALRRLPTVETQQSRQVTPRLVPRPILASRSVQISKFEKHALLERLKKAEQQNQELLTKREEVERDLRGSVQLLKEGCAYLQRQNEEKKRQITRILSRKMLGPQKQGLRSLVK